MDSQDHDPKPRRRRVHRRRYHAVRPRTRPAARRALLVVIAYTLRALADQILTIVGRPPK
jgi:hypothetical protein